MIQKPPNERGRRRGSGSGVCGGGGFRRNTEPGSEKPKPGRQRSSRSPKQHEKGERPVNHHLGKTSKARSNQLPDEPTSPTLAHYMNSKLAKLPAKPEDLQQLAIRESFGSSLLLPPSLGGASSCSGCKHGCTSPLHIPAQQSAHEVHACIVNLLVQYRNGQWGFDKRTTPAPAGISTSSSAQTSKNDLRAAAPVTASSLEKLRRCRPEIQSLRKDWDLYQQAMIRTDLKLTRRDRAIILERQLDTIDSLLRDCRRRKHGDRDSQQHHGEASSPSLRKTADGTNKTEIDVHRQSNRTNTAQTRFADERSDSAKSPRSLVDHLSDLESSHSSTRYTSVTSSNVSSAATSESSYYSSSIYSSGSSYNSDASNSLRAPSLASGDSFANSFVAPPSLAPSHISGGALLGGDAEEEAELDDAFLFLSPGDVDRLLVQSSGPFP